MQGNLRLKKSSKFSSGTTGGKLDFPTCVAGKISPIRAFSRVYSHDSGEAARRIASTHLLKKKVIFFGKTRQKPFQSKLRSILQNLYTLVTLRVNLQIGYTSKIHFNIATHRLTVT